MSDTVKLIIEIPKAEYELIVGDEACGLHPLTRAVAHGIPLDDVKAEIAEEYANTQLMYPDYASGLSHAYEIIVKHVDKAESEDI